MIAQAEDHGVSPMLTTAHGFVALLLWLSPAFPAPTTTWFVDGGAKGTPDGLSWDTAFLSPEGALAVAQDGDTIWVAGGVYRPGGGVLDPLVSFQVTSSVRLLGGFAGNETSEGQRDPSANLTILSGDLGLDDGDWPGTSTPPNARQVLTMTGIRSECLISGFTIERGHWMSSNDSRGAGAYVVASTVRIEDCVFRHNRVLKNGGAVFVSADAVVELRSTVFEANESGIGAALYNDHTSVVVRQCVFRDNHAVGGGALANLGEGEPLIVDSEFIDNRCGGQGAGLYNAQGTEPDVIRCRFVGNRSQWASGGAIYNDQSIPHITDCSFVGNRAYQWGGAMSNWISNPVVERCTFAKNFSDQGGFAAGLVNLAYSSTVVRDCVFWGNQAGQAVDESTQLGNMAESYLDVSYSCILGLTGALGGVGNAGSDPQFVDPVGKDGLSGTMDDDLRLTVGSPCVDAGLWSGGVEGLDLGGMPRLLDGDLDGQRVVDIGAYEFGNVRLDVHGDLAPGGFVVVQAASEVPLIGYLFVARSPGSVVFEPFGLGLFDVTGTWMRTNLGVLPAQMAYSVPASLPVPLSLTMQALGINPATGVGNLSNAVEVAFGD